MTYKGENTMKLQNYMEGRVKKNQGLCRHINASWKH